MLKILLVEDTPSDAVLLQATLDGRYPGQYTTTTATTLAEAKTLLARQAVDAVLLDLSLPDSQGLETIGRLAVVAPNVPIVVLTGVADEGIAMEAVRGGAQDYLLKGQADGAMIARAICYAIDRQQAEEALRAKHRELESEKSGVTGDTTTVGSLPRSLC